MGGRKRAIFLANRCGHPEKTKKKKTKAVAFDSSVRIVKIPSIFFLAEVKDASMCLGYGVLFLFLPPLLDSIRIRAHTYTHRQGDTAG
jgi:hypothetical protein